MSEHKKKAPQKEANRLSVLLRTVLGGDRFPVNIADLAREVSKNNEDPINKIQGCAIDGFEGMLRAHRKRPAWNILYNEDPRYKGRERFTLAHEFGHYMLHRPQLSKLDYKDGQLVRECDFECQPMQMNTWKSSEKIREEEADTFASFLLMPLDDYREQVGRQEMTRDLLGHITDRYGVSLMAAIRKWIEFTDTRAAMVVTTDGFALWGRASKAAYKSGVFIRSGMPIPEAAIAGKGPSGIASDQDKAICLPAGVWNFSRGSEPVRELAFFSQRLGICISLLLFDGDPYAANFEEEEPADTLDHFGNGNRLWRA